MKTATIPEIDLIIGGHSHTHNLEPRMIANAQGTTPTLRAGCFYQWIGMVKLACSPSGIEILHHELIPINSVVPEDAEIAAIVDSLVTELEADPRYGAVYTQIIAESNSELPHSGGYGYKDAPLGNLVTDAIRQATGTQLGIDVRGWLGQPLCAGPLIGADIFQSIPYGYDAETGYGYNLVTFSLSGMLLKSALEFVIHESLTNSDFELQISNAQIIYDSREPMGQKIKSFTVNEQPLRLFSGYTITITDGLADYLALAGLSMVTPEETGLVQYHIVRDYIIENSPINYGVEGRLEDVYETLVPTFETEQLPTQFVLHQNYPNPFNPVTSITYEIPRDEYKKYQHVLLQVFDVRGGEVALLVDEEKPAGIYTELWDSTDGKGENVASGIYLYRLEVDGFAMVKKMILAR